MKRQNKKAFTLVELLVVIAILAILASVAVVGYTSFLKNAALSKDDSTVTQLNRYLEALKADSKSEFYGEDIHAGNIREITAHILEESGLSELEAEAAKYGYDFYYDLQEGKYVSVHGADIGRPGVSNGLFGKNVAQAIGENGEYEVRLENSFTTGNRYFLVSTKGEVAELISDFYALAGDTLQNDLVALVERAKDTDELASYMSGIVVVTNKTNYQVGANPNIVIMVDGVEYISASTRVWEDSDWGIANISDKLANVNHLTLPDSVTAIEDGALNINDGGKIFSEKTAEELSKIANGSFTNANIVNSKGDACTSEDRHILDSANKEIPYSYEHALSAIKIGDASNVTIAPLTSNPVKYVGNEIVIPAEATGFTFNPDLVDNAGNSGKDVLILGAETIEWTVSDTDNVEVSYNVATRQLVVSFKGTARPESFELIANSKIGETRFTVKVENITDGSIKFADTVLANGSTTNLTIIKSSANTVYTIDKNAFTYVHDAETTDGKPVVTETINWTYTGTGLKETSGTGSIEVTGNGEGTLVVNVGTATHTYLTYTINLTIADTSNFPLQPKNNNNFTVLGTGAPILVSDLFDKKGDIPAGAQLVVYNGMVGENDSYMKPDRGQLYATSEGEAGVSVDVPSQTITNDNYSSLALTFAGTDVNNTIRIAVIHNGVRISEDIEVNIVDAVNVKSYDDLKATLSSGAFTENIVLLGNLTMTTDVNTFNIGKNYTLYGNGYQFDIKNGRITEEGIINLQGGTIRDIMIVGSLYTEFAFSAGDDYGSSAVNATGNAKIINSYIANTRSPLRTSGTTTVKDSVLFGGRYSNIDMTGGTITIEGTVTTVQQVYNDVIGMGISAWFNDAKKYVNISEGANLVQYNFMDESIKSKLPALTLKGIYSVLDLKEPFNAMFSDTTTYGPYMYTSNSGNKYANSGIVSTDKYMLNYSITGDSASWSGSYDKGKKKIVTVKTAVEDDETFVIVYDTRFTPKDGVGTVMSAGYLQVTGAQLKAGVEFTVNEKISFNILKGEYDGVPYMFQIQSDNYKTINVTGDGSTNEYSSLTYNFNKDLSGTLGLAQSVLSISMHDRGLHYGKMCVDVNTPKSTAIAYGSTTYQQLLEQYIDMTTNKDSKNYNCYTPENFTFVNGSITNYWTK